MMANASGLASAGQPVTTTHGSTLMHLQTSLPCYRVNSYLTTADQCSFVHEYNCLEDESVIDYVRLFYCELGLEHRYQGLALISALIILYFMALSALADEFLCPSLLAVAKSLGMSDSLAGVTLLAFGNGCPDIFASLAAASDERSELILGELLGAGVFCTSIVSGLILIGFEFDLARRPMLRDTIFYTLSVYLLWLYCTDGIITLYRSLMFILIYILYLCVALGGQAIHSRMRGHYALESRSAGARKTCANSSKPVHAGSHEHAAEPAALDGALAGRTMAPVGSKCVRAKSASQLTAPRRSLRQHLPDDQENWFESRRGSLCAGEAPVAADGRQCSSPNCVHKTMNGRATPRHVTTVQLGPFAQTLVNSGQVDSALSNTPAIKTPIEAKLYAFTKHAGTPPINGRDAPDEPATPTSAPGGQQARPDGCAIDFRAAAAASLAAAKLSAKLSNNSYRLATADHRLLDAQHHPGASYNTFGMQAIANKLEHARPKNNCDGISSELAALAAAKHHQQPHTPEPASGDQRDQQDYSSCVPLWADFFAHVSPIEPREWRDTSGVLARFIMIVRSPLVLVAKLTVPVVDHDKPRANWCRLLNTLHCVIIPSMLVISGPASAPALELFESSSDLHMALATLLGSSLLAGAVWRYSETNVAPRWHQVFAYVGFVMSVVWVYTLATEVISLLKTVGIVLGMSDEGIGLGFLAWGNSLSDIFANLALAKAGYPRMALGASIGAPLLNLLMGFGLAFSLNLRLDEVATIEYSPTMTLLCGSLVTMLVIHMLITLIPPSVSKRPFGYLLCACYALYFSLAVCIEYNLVELF